METLRIDVKGWPENSVKLVESHAVQVRKATERNGELPETPPTSPSGQGSRLRRRTCARQHAAASELAVIDTSVPVYAFDKDAKRFEDSRALAAQGSRTPLSSSPRRPSPRSWR